MSEAPQSQGLTLTRQRVAEVLASGEAQTMTEAAQLARTSRATMYRSLQSETVQREIERQRGIQADKAKDLKALSSKKLAARIAGDEASDALLLGTYKTANDVLASGVEDDAAPIADAGDYARARAKLMQAVKVGRYLQRRLDRHAPPQR